MAREITPGTHWINETYTDGERRLHVAVYLIESEEGYVLIDTGSFNDREAIRREITDLVGGSSLDAIIVSHADLPHSGNVPWFEAEFPDVEILSPSNYPAIVGLPADATVCPLGGSMAVAGRRFSFVYPPLCDLQHSAWIFDEASGVLYTADGFGNYHRPDQRDALYAEIEDELSVEDVREFHIDTLRWLKYVDPEKLRRGIESVFERYDVSWVAPIHGNPIERRSIDSYMETFTTAVEEIDEGYDPDTDDVVHLPKRGTEL